MNRRSFLQTMLALSAAPAIAKAGVLMPIKPLTLGPGQAFTGKWQAIPPNSQVVLQLENAMRLRRVSDNLEMFFPVNASIDAVEAFAQGSDLRVCAIDNLIQPSASEQPLFFIPDRALIRDSWRESESLIPAAEARYSPDS